MSKKATRPIELGAAAAAHADTSRVDIEIVECRHPHLIESFSYTALIHDKETGSTATVDTAEASAIHAALKRRGWTLTHILITHHHIDHTLGNVELIKAFPNVKVYGGDREKELIPGITHVLLQHKDGHSDTTEQFQIGSLDCVAIDTAGHTVGHLAYYFPGVRAVFCGDALFTLGVGRMMEGNAEAYWGSMKRFRSLPDDTVVYSAHEYAESNIAFALSVDPTNETLRRVGAEIKRLRHPSSSSMSSPSSSAPMPAMPSLMWQEKEANPFLRADNKTLRANAGIGMDVSDAEAFGLLRKAKDTFKPGAKKEEKDEKEEKEKEKKKAPQVLGVQLGAAAAKAVDSNALEVMMISNDPHVPCDGVSRSPSSTPGATAAINPRTSYSFVVRDPKSGRVGLIDPCVRELESIHSAIAAREWQSPSVLFLTNPTTSTTAAPSVATTSCLMNELRKVFPSIQDALFDDKSGTELDGAYQAGDATLAFGATVCRVLPIKGTGTSEPRRETIERHQEQQQRFAFHFPAANVAFVGNEFTILGYRDIDDTTSTSNEMRDKKNVCATETKEGGRTPRTEGWNALRSLRDGLPSSTVVYTTQESAGHDAQFAVWADGGNFDTQMAVIQVARRRAQRPRPLPTVPFVMSDARLANPFLRMDVPSQKEGKFERDSSVSAIRVVSGIDFDISDDEAFEELKRKREVFFGHALRTMKQ